ncbi:MAG: lipopolysaccharide heptosyltransferase I [Chlamydiia bacterium]|nr:lipopolysaccharide heptosyltransferase I [Chlamydiia bacterium]
MKILIVKTSSLGDVIQSLPVVAFLKHHFPHSEIDWAVEKPFADILKAHPAIHRVIPLEVRKWKKHLIKHRNAIRLALQALRRTHYDVLFDLQGNIKSALVTKSARAKEKVGMTFASAPEWPNALVLNRRYAINRNAPISLQYLSIPEQYFSQKPHPFPTALTLEIFPEESEWVTSILKGTHRTMVCPGSHWENKKLPLPTWIELLKKLGDTHFYFVWGNAKEEQEAMALHVQFPERSTLLPRMRLPVWQTLMTQMHAIYTVDSSALHLAATTSVPTYSFFGPSNASVYKPSLVHHQAIQGPCPYGKSFRKRCPILRTCKTGACLKALSPDDLISNLK